MQHEQPSQYNKAADYAEIWSAARELDMAKGHY
jgi:hypothetical protein